MARKKYVTELQGEASMISSFEYSFHSSLPELSCLFQLLLLLKYMECTLKASKIAYRKPL